MAQRAGYSASTLSQAAAGEQLPTLAVVLAYVRACGGDPGEWEGRWREATEELAAQTGQDEDGVEPPYRGLARFETGDSAWFFGRSQLTADLLDLMRRRRFAAVFGPSGSGKSSLLRAGLIPALRHTQEAGLRPAVIRILTPGEHPARAHAPLLAPADPSSGGAGTLVIVDQFEEVFTLCQDLDERARFIDVLLAAGRPGSGLRVLLGVRADFYGHCAGHRELAEALRDANVLVGPMSAAELREVIVRPAAAAGLTVERALTSRLIEEVGDAPGGLPLLSHVLLETWRRRRGKTLTTAGYEASGGLHGAIAQSAETVYAGLSSVQAAHARRMLLRLISPGEGASDTGRPAERDELLADRPGEAATVLERLAQARLVTLEETTVSLTHEALITGWPRLYGWIEEDRERLRLLCRLTDSARAWQELGWDADALYRGARLAAAREAFAEDEGLTALERSFLEASVTAYEEEQRSAARAARRLRLLVGALSVLLVMAVIAIGLAVDQRQIALTAQERALSRQLAAQSRTLEDANSDLSALLAVAAYRISPTLEATTSLYAADAEPAHRRITGSGTWNVVAFGPKGLLASCDEHGAVRLWDVRTGLVKKEFAENAGPAAGSLAFSPSGHHLAATSIPGTVRLRDITTGRIRARFVEPSGQLFAVTFVSEGHALGLGGDGHVWDVVTGHPKVTLAGLENAALDEWSAVFSPDGRSLATHTDHTTRLWDLASGRLRATLTSDVADRIPMAFSPDGQTLATGHTDDTVRLWDVATGRRKAILAAGHHSGTLAFSPDGRTLATSNTDNTVRLWDVSTGRAKEVLTGLGQGAVALAFSPDSDTLATRGTDGAIQVWDLTPPLQATFADPQADRVTVQFSAMVQDGDLMEFSPDGRTLAICHNLTAVQLWDVSQRDAN